MLPISPSTLSRIERGEAWAGTWLCSFVALFKTPPDDDEGLYIREVYRRYGPVHAFLALCQIIERQNVEVSRIHDKIPIDPDPVGYSTLGGYARRERKLLVALRKSEPGIGLPRKAVYRLFGNKLNRAEIEVLLKPLEQRGLVRSEPRGRSIRLVATKLLLSGDY